MKKMANFIVEKNKFILALFLLMSIFCLFLMSKVHVNSDLAEYLPKNSETRVGNDIMNDEFEPLKSSSLYIMFENLEDKKQVLDYLEHVDNVSSVSYDDTSDYNKDKYTLYIVNVDDTSDSKTSKIVYQDITHHFKNKNIYLAGDIANSNREVLPSWIIFISILSALIILIIMSDNLVEPFLIFFTVGMAVFLNKGSNIMFSSVSNVTNSIVAILQMALSMDYSIILINRFKQEKKHSKDNMSAMKVALHKSISSIASSSLTTIVGLLVLVFMTFTLGRDLGVVLAKGVLLSLICIFFCLPGLLLMFDKFIDKTHKKILEPKFNFLSKFTFKFRYITLILMIALFCFSYTIKGNLKFLYTESGKNKVGEVFESYNQMAIVYDNSDEDKLREYCNTLEKNEKIDRVVCVGNTIDKKLKYDELKEHVDKLGDDISDIDDYILKILYYNYFNRDIDNKMTFTEFVEFIRTEIYNNDELKEQVDENKDKIELLKYFTYIDEIEKLRTSKELSEIFGIPKEDIDLLLVYYTSKNNVDVKMTLKEFLSFVNNKVMKDSKYSSYISSYDKEQLKLLSKYTNNIDKKMNSKELSQYFELDKKLVDNLYVLYIINGKIDTKISVKEFIDFTLNYVVKDKTYSKNFDKETINNLKELSKFTNKKYITKKVGSKELSKTFNIPEEQVKELLYLYYANYDSNDEYTLIELIQNIKYIKENTNYLDDIDYKEIINSSDYMEVSLNKETLYKYFDKELVDAIYDAFGLDSDYELSIKDILNIISKHLDEEKLEEYKKYLDENIKLNKEIIENLENYIDPKILENVNSYIKDSVDKINNNSKKYNSTELAELLKVDKKVTNNIYALIKLVNGDTDDWVLSRLEFVEHLLNNKKYLDDNQISKLQLLLKVMNSTLNGTKYKYNELSKVLGIDKASIKSIYGLYTYKKKGLKLSPYKTIKFIINNKDNEKLSEYLNKNYMNKIYLVDKIFTSVKNNTKYNYKELSSLFGINSDKLKLLFSIYKNEYSTTKISINKFTNFIVDDVLNSEYKKSFDNKSKEKITVINGIVNNSLNKTKYNKDEMITILSKLSDELDKNTIELLYIYFGSFNDYDNEYSLTILELVNYLNDDIIKDEKFESFIDKETKEKIVNSKTKVDDAYKALVGKKHSRMVLITNYETETDETFEFVKSTRSDLKTAKEAYLIGNSPMANDISETFNSEFNFITILTMVAIFIVVALTFKSIISPLIITLIIQCSVFTTMGILSFSGDPISFIAVLVVQSILMGATIDYGIVYTTYYLENRQQYDLKESIVKSYRKSSHTILTSGCILIIVTLIVGLFADDVVSKICLTLSIGTTCSVLLIMLILPGVLAALDKIIMHKYNKKINN